MVLEYVVKKDDGYKTIREVLLNEFCFSHRFLSKMKLHHRIYCNGVPMYVDKLVQFKDRIVVDIDLEEEATNIVPTPMKLSILYEDDCFLIVNKPAEVAIHPSSNHYCNSLSNGIMYYYKSIGLKKKIHLVNRLDKGTSGIVVIAKNEYLQECLIKQMKKNIFHKEYIALLEGILEIKNDTINVTIKRKANSIIERCVALDGDVAITHYKVLRYIGQNTLVKFQLETGRTHQLRVHSKYIGHPIVGDTLYGNSSILIARQALHAYKTSFYHPILKKQIIIEAPFPEDIKLLLN